MAFNGAPRGFSNEGFRRICKDNAPEKFFFNAFKQGRIPILKPRSIEMLEIAVSALSREDFKTAFQLAEIMFDSGRHPSLSCPAFSEDLYESGKKQESAGNIVSASKSYQLSLAWDPDGFYALEAAQAFRRLQQRE